MAYEIIWTEEAGEDLKSIIDYLKNEWPASVAEHFVEILYEKITLLSTNPHIGKPSEKEVGVRRIVITQHNTLFYLVETNSVTLLNIFDTRQNPDKSMY